MEFILKNGEVLKFYFILFKKGGNVKLKKTMWALLIGLAAVEKEDR